MAIDNPIKGAYSKNKNTVSGSVEKAVLHILDNRDVEVEEKEKETSVKTVSGMISGVTDKIKEFAKEKAPNLMAMAENVLGAPNLDENAKKYEVQFNPQSLKITAVIPETKTEKNVDGSGNKVEQSNSQAEYKLSMKLIFDESNALIIAEGNVQKQVEGLLAAISNEKTISCGLTWGDQIYMGCFDSINVSYTMFDGFGTPIRAEMDLTIALSPGWDEDYKQFISQSTTSQGNSVAGAANGMFNFIG